MVRSEGDRARDAELTRRARWYAAWSLQRIVVGVLVFLGGMAWLVGSGFGLPPWAFLVWTAAVLVGWAGWTLLRRRRDRSGGGEPPVF
ncbi:hypothetical protein ACFSBZ_10930 [Amnibacterium flavum]|uniref:Uncharacterized protein n=1 Tax=Amnibacterium flavum TaxID=2173173 RepID=A0A2V1HY54_9MICO|nr:hypothetical protein [Amnibacterium flavum]PVZ95344.1 hypothetical protein DDQ50_02155 [Amnibacterium flavum]